MTISVRPARSTDQAYVAASWVACLAPKERSSRAFAELNLTVDRLLDDQRTQVLVACEASDSDRIVGWCAFATIPGVHVLEFVLVRNQRRREGIATQLLVRAKVLDPLKRFVFLFDTADWKSMNLGGTLLSPGEFLL